MQLGLRCTICGKNNLLNGCFIAATQSCIPCLCNGVHRTANHNFPAKLGMQSHGLNMQALLSFLSRRVPLSLFPWSSFNCTWRMGTKFVITKANICAFILEWICIFWNESTPQSWEVLRKVVSARFHWINQGVKMEGLVHVTLLANQTFLISFLV